ncbi:hypothetical protein Ahp1_05 [Aeromonas phage Ahp1]|uniref:Uncharacterized protein n=1 Tax=Aeromonas phage Ahp1 TaxID=1747286 RepID=A0A1S5Q9V3_9CAUD|nr:hypothetical protein HOS19_gp05 [Aeromonas phage Ahp1]ALP47724.1 hypothetical protein Ahp1_05 [Aeromonas phage Ahp1]
MQISKYLLKWCAILCLGLIACAAIIVPGLAIYAKVDAPLFSQLLTASLIIIAACIFLIICLLEYKQ